MTIEQVLRASGIDAREARLLLAAATGRSEASVLAHPEKSLLEQEKDQFLEMTARRAAGEPIAYILGHKEFYGLELTVNSAVLIPRPETELLVDLALDRNPASVLDVGTGSGAIALAIKRHRPDARVVATDASAAALEVARRNAARFNLEVELRHGRWFEPVAGERFEAIISNPPYVVVGDPHLAALPYEPRRRAARRRRRSGRVPRAGARGAGAPAARRVAAGRAWRRPARGGTRVAGGGGP